MENLHLVEVSYCGATNSRGSRVRLYSHRFKQSVFLSYDYDIGQILQQAEKYLLGKGHKLVGHCEMKDGSYGVLCEAVDSMFTPLK